MSNNKERIRKEYTKTAGRTQKLQSYRIDCDLIDKLKMIQNRGRLINKLLRDYFNTFNIDESQQDIDPSWNQLEDSEK